MFDVWSTDIDHSIRLIKNTEDAQNWIMSSMVQTNDHINGRYQFLQKIRSYFRTHHNGKPLTNIQRDCLIMAASYHEAVLKYSCVPVKHEAS